MIRSAMAGVVLGGALLGLPAAAEAPARIEMSDDGPVLVTPAGMTLYTTANDDATPGQSFCTARKDVEFDDPTAGFGKYPLPGHRDNARSCAEVWPPFMAPTDARAEGDWSTISRAEGKQWAYRGKPLYRSIADHKPGDRNGGITQPIFVPGFKRATPPLDLPPGLRFTRVGDELVLASAKGEPLYTPRGARLQQACAGCADSFTPVAAASLANLSGDWTTAEPSPGVRQYVYKSRPLFAAPAGMTQSEIERDREWTRVVFRKLAPPPAEIRTRFTLLGDVYTSKAGLTLYTFNCLGFQSQGCEQPGGPAAYWSALCGDARECSRRWRPYRAEPGAVNSGDWTVMEVPDPIFSDPTGPTWGKDLPRVRAWAWRGKPVYTYHADKQPGDIWGHQTRWFALSSFSAVQVPGRGAIE